VDGARHDDRNIPRAAAKRIRDEAGTPDQREEAHPADGAVVERDIDVAERVRQPRVRIAIRGEMHRVHMHVTLQPVQVHPAQGEAVGSLRLLRDSLHSPPTQQRVDDSRRAPNGDAAPDDKDIFDDGDAGRGAAGDTDAFHRHPLGPLPAAICETERRAHNEPNGACHRRDETLVLCGHLDDTQIHPVTILDVRHTAQD